MSGDIQYTHTHTALYNIHIHVRSQSQFARLSESQGIRVKLGSEFNMQRLNITHLHPPVLQLQEQDTVTRGALHLRVSSPLHFINKIRFNHCIRHVFITFTKLRIFRMILKGKRSPQLDCATAG